MQSELCNAHDFIPSDGDLEASINLILEGAKRDLKLRQAAMIKHSVVVKQEQVYIVSEVDIFARGRKFVIGFFVAFLLAIIIAIFNSTESWAEQVKLLKTMAMVMVVFMPIAYAYLMVEKWVQHHRLHHKIESKLNALISAQPMVNDLLDSKASATTASANTCK